MKNDAQVYDLYGLRVCSEIALPAPRAQSDLPPYDLEFCQGEGPAIPDDAPSGRVLAELDLGGGRGYTLTDGGNDYALRFHGIGDFRIDPDLRTIHVCLLDGIGPEVAALFLVGNVVACVLTLAGESVLHASAVETNGAALAIAGGSGMGKSSLAALLCAQGARFVTDDLLRLQPDGKGWRCFPGTGQLRLRKDAASLAEGFPASRLSTTPDDRVAVRMPDNPSMPLLRAIVVPHRTRDGDMVKMERLARSEALFHLMAYPRIRELPRNEPFQRRIDFLGRVATSVPVFKAHIPWGLPPPVDLVSSLMRGAGIEA
ncbi:hypothetical protein JW916_12140 [Candidatus Sumerlaeota bacterium]|nr:hypothetical protein [Candidatus Sumerlaeota bacterium]